MKLKSGFNGRYIAPLTIFLITPILAGLHLKTKMNPNMHEWVMTSPLEYRKGDGVYTKRWTCSKCGVVTLQTRKPNRYMGFLHLVKSTPIFDSSGSVYYAESKFASLMCNDITAYGVMES